MEVGKGWNGQRSVWRGTLCRSDGKITVGVCAREKKARSKHMEAITSRLDSGKFDVVVFGDDCIMNKPVEDWPMCDCLVAFYSTGFPSDKARAYVELRRPYALNNLEMEPVLHDRRKVYDLLKENRVPHPDNVYASRDGYGGQNAKELTIVEADDYIQVNNVTIHKPFVEKPINAEDHNVYIYYPMSAGGGSKRLFRKIGDRSSEFYPDVNEIRRQGSFVYEAFVETQGTDVKVYTVGPDYGHAEARKSPTLDGKVNRNAKGKEIRYPVILSPEEKEYARTITLAFKQCVCGFDILRVQGKSYVCDVNGWSFVKNSRKYVEDCAMLLQEFIEAAVKPGRKTKVFSTKAPLIKYGTFKTNEQQRHKSPHQQQQQQKQQQLSERGGQGRARSLMTIEKPPLINTNVPNGHGHRLNYPPHSPDSSVGSASTPGSREPQSGAFAVVGSPASTPPRSPSDGRLLKHQRKHPEELRAVIAITRHGDRTPKQKMKMKISFPPFLAFYNKYSPGPRKEIKVKGKAHLKEFLGITVELIKTLRIASPPSSGFPQDMRGERGAGKKRDEPRSSSDTDMTPDSNGNSNGSCGDEQIGNGNSGTTEVDAETFGKLHQIKHVLERWEISGINRKLQLKPRQWEELDSPPPSSEEEQGENGKLGSKPLSSAPVGLKVGVGMRVGDAIGIKDDFMSSPLGDGEGGRKKRERATQLMLILKWGGELTNLGQRQAIELGNSFRTIMYPDSGTGGLLRLHSTFRHDLKIKTSDEGRVMKTAAAFAKGLLELEGELTPILVSLVSKENRSVTMLDPSGNKDIKKEMEKSKEFLHGVMSKDVTFTSDVIKGVVPTAQASVRRALRSIGNPVAKLRHLRQLVAALVKQLSRRSATFPLGTMDNRVSAADRELDRGIEADEFATSRVEIAEAREKRHNTDSCVSSEANSSSSSRTGRDLRLPARGETPLLMLDRWRKLHNELYDPVTGFDISKIPDVHDNVRYDGLHNAHLELEGLHELYDLAKHLADSIVPQEYGITKRGKLAIGAKMCHALLDKIKYDLIVARADNEVDMRYQLDIDNVEDLPIHSLGRRVRTRLYFTSESHLHTLLNVLRFPIDGRQPVVTAEARRMLSRTKELCYLTSFVIRLFEDTEKDIDDPARFRVEILFSPGVVKHPLLSGDHLHTAPLVPLHKNLTFKQVVDTLEAANALATESNNDEAESESDAILKKLEAVVEQRRQQRQHQQEDESERSGGRGECLSPPPSGLGLLQGAGGTEQEQRTKRSRMCSHEPRHLRRQHRYHEGGLGRGDGHSAAEGGPSAAAASHGDGCADGDGGGICNGRKPEVWFLDDFRSRAEGFVEGAAAASALADGRHPRSGEQNAGYRQRQEQGPSSASLGYQEYDADGVDGSGIDDARGFLLAHRRRVGGSGSVAFGVRGGDYEGIRDGAGRIGNWEEADGVGDRGGHRDSSSNNDHRYDDEDNDGFESDVSDVGRAVQARLASDPFLPVDSRSDGMMCDGDGGIEGGGGGDGVDICHGNYNGSICGSARSEENVACGVNLEDSATDSPRRDRGDIERPSDRWFGVQNGGTKLAVTALVGALSVVATGAVAIVCRRRPR